ncbi:hypothetical protein F4778DRAFT_802097 [Xylariomycetidae sp. FL2044]|nr:hypothetical protein F4778DRAFT_802097 [Xylariomycetidae sp. FL2044]
MYFANIITKLRRAPARSENSSPSFSTSSEQSLFLRDEKSCRRPSISSKTPRFLGCFRKIDRRGAIYLALPAVFIVLLFILLFVLVPLGGHRAESPGNLWTKDFPQDNEVDGVSLWLQNFSHTVAPLPCHSHNDYWRPHPLFNALGAGCTGIEADVWLSEDRKDLLVGHKRGVLSPDKTLKSMYLDPLLRILERRNPEDVWSNNTIHDRAKGVFETSPNTTLTLMIDVKEKPDEIWPLVVQQIEPFRSQRFLYRVEKVDNESQAIWPAPIVVVGSGEMNLTSISKPHPSYDTYHDTFLDAPLASLPKTNIFSSSEDPEATTPGQLYTPENSYYASTSFQQTIGSVAFGFTHDQMEKLRTQIRVANQSGLVSRYWDSPSWPINYRDYIWNVLSREGVSMLSVDDLDDAVKRSWDEEYLGSVAFMVSASVICAIVFWLVAFLHLRGNKSNSV